MVRRIPVFLSLLVVSLGAREETPQRQPFTSGTTAIVIDAVVRDGKGLPVTDLRKEDFELLEDGVRQDIADLTLVAPPALSGAAGPATAGRQDAARASAGEPPPAVAAPTFVAIVFDRLGPEARALAHKGALAYLDTFHEHDFAGVFVSGGSLVMLQTFTNDRAQLRRAIERAGHRPTAASGETYAAASPTAGAESAGTPAAPAGGPVNAAPIAPPIPSSLSQSMFNTWEALTADQLGHQTVNALLAVTSAMGMLPGRKALVFFAEGLALPDNVMPEFRSVVMTANKANVSVYTVDAAGLRVHSPQAATGRELLSMGVAGITLNPDGSNRSTTAMMIRNEEMLRSDPRTSLTLLAGQTGGFLIDSTNDLARAFRTIDADRRFHYLLTYTPKNSDFKGEWRNVAVKVRGRPVEVRARAGYLAVRAPGALPLLAYEGPALAALDRTPPPQDVPVRAAVHVFPGSPEPRLTVLAAARGADLTFARDEQAGTYRSDFTVVARIRDAAGEVVRKASQPFRLSDPLGQAEAAQRGDVLFYRQPTLGPGTYTLEVAVHDALARRAGVHTSAFTVPPQTDGAPRVSSLVIIQRGEKVPAAEQPVNYPLSVGDVLLYPNVGDPVRKADKGVTVYFVVDAASGAPAATLDVVRGGQTLATLPIVLDPPDASGRLRHLAQLPTAALAPGDYTLRLTVTHGGRRAAREASFRLAE